MTEAGLGGFDECVEAIKKFKGDENAACQYLIDQNMTATKQWKISCELKITQALPNEQEFQYGFW